METTKLIEQAMSILWESGAPRKTIEAVNLAYGLVAQEERLLERIRREGCIR